MTKGSAEAEVVNAATDPDDGGGHEGVLQPLNLPALNDDADYDWDEIKDNWLRQTEESRAKEDTELILEYEDNEAILLDELTDAAMEYNRRVEALLQARVLVDEKEADLHWLLDEYTKKQRKIQDCRTADDLRVLGWITRGRDATNKRRGAVPNGRGSNVDGRDSDVSRATGIFSPSVEYRRMRAASGHPGATPPRSAFNAEWERSRRPPSPAQSRTHPPNGERFNRRGVAVVTSTGSELGTLLPIYAENHWIQSLLERPIKRPVEIRLGRKFSQTNLDNIYSDQKDQKKSKWLSFMIQATGYIQDHPCQTCAKGQGLFSQCIIVGGPDFPRCGNCEWNKQGCHGASGPVTGTSTSTDAHGHRRHPHAGYAGDVSSRLYGNGNGLSSTVLQSGDPSSLNARKTDGQGPRSSKPLNDTADVQAREDMLPATPQPLELEPFLVKELSPTAVMEEITRDTLLLKDDGMIFLEPELMRGVPLRKISPDHAYWDPNWKPLDGTIQAKYDEWMAKLKALKQTPEASLTERDRTAIFQAGRQVNRGTAIMKYLRECDFHPYQLVAKQFITPAFSHYDTLFRMVATLDELAKFRLNVTPLQWLRQRLHELYMEKQASFKLDRIISKLYHDPKLSHLRSKNGFGNIGRPSAAASKRRNSDVGIGSVSESGGKKRVAEKRKEPRNSASSATSTPTKQQVHTHADSESLSGKDGGPRTKRQRVIAPWPSEQGLSQPRQQHDTNGKAAATPTANVTVVSGHQQKLPNDKRRIPSSARRHDALPQPSTASHGAATNGHSDGHAARSARSTSPTRGQHEKRDAKEVDDDLEYSGYTSRDSLTNDMVVRKDWRVCQVKTSDLTSNPRTTQYWHWVDEEHAYQTSGPGGPQDFDPMFEHQVLKETEPRTGWGVFKEPIDFHLRLRELTSIAYASQSLTIVISTRKIDDVKYRGDVLARFKRERTKRRFLAFVAKQGVALRRVPRTEIDREWNEMQSEVMAGNESE